MLRLSELPKVKTITPAQTAEAYERLQKCIERSRELKKSCLELWMNKDGDFELRPIKTEYPQSED